MPRWALPAITWALAPLGGAAATFGLPALFGFFGSAFVQADGNSGYLLRQTFDQDAIILIYAPLAIAVAWIVAAFAFRPRSRRLVMMHAALNSILAAGGAAVLWRWLSTTYIGPAVG